MLTNYRLKFKVKIQEKKKPERKKYLMDLWYSCCTKHRKWSF